MKAEDAGNNLLFYPNLITHLVEKWENGAEKTEERLLGVINDFGDPREIAEDYRSKSETEARPKGSYPPTWLVLVLTVFLWPAGIILAWISPAWKLRDKIIATLIPVVLTGALILFNFASYSHFHHQGVEEVELFEGYGLIQPDPVKRGCF